MDPPLRDAIRSLGGAIAWRGLEGLAFALAVAYVSIRYADLDYTGTDAAIPLCIGAGWLARCLPRADDREEIFFHVGLLAMFGGLVAAILEMPMLALLVFLALCMAGSLVLRGVG